MSTDARPGRDALVDHDEALAAGIVALGSTVGVDTEFMRVRTFHPIPALYQVAADTGVLLIDAQAAATFAPLKALLLDPARRKVMHACSEDLEVIAVHLGLRPVAVLDTQLAHAFLAPEYSAGYVKLVKHYLGRTLSQHETRSDWLARPLSDAQICYAREDAAYLVPIWERQRDALDRCGRLSWFEEDMRRILSAVPETPETWYRTIKGIWRLTRRELAVLKSLTRWRELEARRRDIPRAWVAADDRLATLARRAELRASDVASVLPRRVAARYGKALVTAHRAGLADPEPPARIPPPLKQAATASVKDMRRLAGETAARLGVAKELVARKRDLEALYRHYRDHRMLPPDWFDGWRAEVLGGDLEELLRRTL